MTSEGTIKEGPSVAEAIDAALEELGVQQDAVEYEVLDEPGKSGLFGKASDKPARVRVWLKQSYAREVEEARRTAREILETGGAEEAERPSDEDIDKMADAAAVAIQEILRAFGLSCEVDEYEGDYGEIILDVVGDDLAILIGRHGRTLDALQTLTAAVAYRTSGVRYPLLVDVAGYRYRRKAKLDEMAKQAADRVRRTGKPVKMRPMSSYERKVIHMALREDARVLTASEGEEPFRQVVVMPR